MSALKSLRLIVTNLISFCCYCYIWLMCPVEVKNVFLAFLQRKNFYLPCKVGFCTSHAQNYAVRPFTCLTLENLYSCLK